MTKQILVLIVAAGLTSPAWTAENNAAPKEERMGFGSGFVVGALAGGPIGAIVGAAVGGWTGNRFHRERSEKLDYEQRYEQATTDADSLEGLLQASERDHEGHRRRGRRAGVVVGGNRERAARVDELTGGGVGVVQMKS